MSRPLNALRRAVVSRSSMRMPEHVNDVESATLRYLLYVLLPAWFAPGVLDWWQHRRTDIQHTAGVKESAIHLLMMAEVGIPVTLVLLCEINPAVLAVMAAAVAAHEATALWDVKTAVDSGREVRPIEQHIHSFLESLPFMGTSAIACLHWRQVRQFLRAEGAWRLQWKKNPLPSGYLVGVAAAIGALIALPYGEELIRCVRAARRRQSEVDIRPMSG
ncbi:diguanylate cyclase/phosphodiesterase [Kutzneria sp. NPDC052558]|uniref:diguanylate cyclase/phosphodiesterase n=1 Tax=Kutzneria sp. NPDC052558 TaxID=3364121 RepID=UPI0037CB75D8